MNSKSTMTSLLRLSVAAKLLGVTTTTIRTWDRTGILKTVRSPGGHRLVPLAEVERLRGEVGAARTITLVYARCSTHKQQDNLERQVGRLLEHCANEKWPCELYKDIGSGLNDNRKQFLKLIKRVAKADVARVIVEYKDRLCRYGFSVFEGYCASLGVEVVVLRGDEPKEFEMEFAEDVVALIASFSARLYGRRGGKKKTENVSNSDRA